MKMNCKELLNQLASNSPTPGGGSATAYVSAIGIALGNMVGSLTVANKKYQDIWSIVEELNASSQKLINDFLNLYDEDVAVFDNLSRAYKMPKRNEVEKQNRNRVLQNALVSAAQVPIKLASVIIDSLNLQNQYFQVGTKMAISDVGAGTAFLKSSLYSAKLNVYINTRMMKDSTVAKKLESRIDALVAKGELLADEVYNNVFNYITRSK